jgi:hypothetical protein
MARIATRLYHGDATIAGGEILTGSLLRRHRGAAVTGLAVGVVIAVLVAGQILAIRRADAASVGVTAFERDQATVSAHTFWDNPFQRLAFRAYGVQRIPRSGLDGCAGTTEGPMYRVTAYALFGIELDHISCGLTPRLLSSNARPLPAVGPH